MVFGCFQQVSHLSEAFTLEPGDVIATGTPAGVGSAYQPFPEGFLKVGDRSGSRSTGSASCATRWSPSPTVPRGEWAMLSGEKGSCPKWRCAMTQRTLKPRTSFEDFPASAFAR